MFVWFGHEDNRVNFWKLDLVSGKQKIFVRVHNFQKLTQFESASTGLKWRWSWWLVPVSIFLWFSVGVPYCLHSGTKNETKRTKLRMAKNFSKVPQDSVLLSVVFSNFVLQVEQWSGPLPENTFKLSFTAYKNRHSHLSSNSDFSNSLLFDS